MKSLSAKFHLAMGLTSIVISVILLAVLLNLIPDRRQEMINGRVILAESIASSSTLLLGNNDYTGLSANLEFSINRKPDLVAASLKRGSDEDLLIFGDKRAVTDNTSEASTESRIVLPILKNDKIWGEIVLHFEDSAGKGWLGYLHNSRFALIGFSGITCFVLFYLYLGRMLKALNPSKAVPGRVRSALDTLAEALLVIDKRSNVVLANTAFQKITGKTADDILGNKASDFSWHNGDTHPQASEEPTDMEFPWETALNNKQTLRGAPLWLRDHHDNWHKFLVNCSPIITGNDANGVLISLDDITELEEKENELRLARDAAELANEAKTSFLSNMSHEIRTPMTAILGFTDVLKRGNGQSDRNWQKHLNTISNSGQHLLELINDVLDLSKVESGALEVEQIECKPYMVAHDVVQVLNVRAEAKSISLEIEIPQALPETIVSDGSRLRQIITNLVGNAIKFTESGGVKIILRTEAVKDKTGQTLLAIDVADSGIGIGIGMNDQQLRAIFKPFVQADSSITRRFGGTGLGLAISKKLSRALGGDITVTSETSVGTTFTATVTTGSLQGVAMLSPEEIFESMDKNNAEQKKFNWTFPESKILVVDDAAENRELITLVLTDLGIESDTAENGAIAVQMANDRHYDVIMSDIQMPVMDGYAAVKEMRHKGIDQPVIALTANAMKGYEQKILASGFSHYMTKPIDIDALTSLLAELLGGESVAIVNEENTQPEVTGTISPSDNNPIYSRMGESESLGHVVGTFIEKLHDHIPQIETAFAARDYQEVSSLAHWLKGSGGTVGFDDLYEPSKALEISANNSQDDKIELHLSQIKALSVRLRSGTPENLTDQNQTFKDAHSSDNKLSYTQDNLHAVDKPIVSRLAEKNPAFRPIVVKFVSRLDERFEEMEDAIANDDYEGIAALAHWLKGSSGTVGFVELSEPAAQMEQFAKEKNNKHLGALMQTIRTHRRNIVVPGNDDGPTVAEDSA